MPSRTRAKSRSSAKNSPVPDKQKGKPARGRAGKDCPVPATEDKYTEAHYFVSRMLDEYHEPFPFRWNLNAFLQALRAVTFILQSELSGQAGFDAWYEERREIMMDDPLLRRFVQGRNTVVHQGMLNRRSDIQTGLFRGYTLKLAFQFEASLDEPSKDILKRTQDTMLGYILDEEHSAIGEQLGVRREWIVKELGDDEVVSLCDKAWARVGKVVAGAHTLTGVKFEVPPEAIHDLEVPSILLESDVDPGLLNKWDW